MRRFWSREEKKLTVLHKHISQKQKIWLLIKTLYFDYSALDVICVLMFNFLIIAILMNISICEKTENVSTFLGLGGGQCPPKKCVSLTKIINPKYWPKLKNRIAELICTQLWKDWEGGGPGCTGGAQCCKGGAPKKTVPPLNALVRPWGGGAFVGKNSTLLLLWIICLYD